MQRTLTLAAMGLVMSTQAINLEDAAKDCDDTTGANNVDINIDFSVQVGEVDSDDEKDDKKDDKKDDEKEPTKEEICAPQNNEFITCIQGLSAATKCTDDTTAKIEAFIAEGATNEVVVNAGSSEAADIKAYLDGKFAEAITAGAVTLTTGDAACSSVTAVASCEDLFSAY